MAAALGRGLWWKSLPHYARFGGYLFSNWGLEAVLREGEGADRAGICGFPYLNTQM